MVKVNYNGNFIELNDELEKGTMELDMLTPDEEDNTIELNNVVEKVINSLENTVEFEAVESYYE